MAKTVDVVEFTLGDERYALDIHLVREIVEMMPITPIPRAPPYISGVINLRGEITNIMNINTLLGLGAGKQKEMQKIIVLMPEAAGGNNVGVIVDDVTSVTPVAETQVEHVGEGLTGEGSDFVKGIIKIDGGETEKMGKGLVIWLDLQRVIKDLVHK
jgi:purine-binding chemotaxis protein CheW